MLEHSAPLPMRSYTKKDGTCPTCGQIVPLHRNRIATHGWPVCAGTGEKPMPEPAFLFRNQGRGSNG